jgi:hypothetical protein
MFDTPAILVRPELTRVQIHAPGHEPLAIRSTWQMFHYRGDIDLYRARYGKAEGEARFFAENVPFASHYAPENILAYGGASAIWQQLIGSGAITAFNNANAFMGFGDGQYTAIGGTSAFTNASTAVTGTGTAYTTDLAVGDYITLNTDGVLYKVAAIGSNTALTLATAFAGTTGSGASSKQSPTETDLKASTNKVRKAMDAGFPTHTDGTGAAAASIVYQATLGATDGNWGTGIQEVGLFNASSGGRMLNRKVQNLGVKTAGNTAAGKLTITLG